MAEKNASTVSRLLWRNPIQEADVDGVELANDQIEIHEAITTEERKFEYVEEDISKGK